MAGAIADNFLGQVRIPKAGDKIYKDECMYSFDTPESPTGLYVCLHDFQGFGRQQIDRHYHKTNHGIYLHLKRIKHEMPSTNKPEEKEKTEVTRLAIGLEGGYALDEGTKYEYEENNTVCILPEFTEYSLTDPILPEMVQASVAGILSADSLYALEDAQALAATWDGEARPVTKHAKTLQQLDNGVRIPPRGWQCSKCDKTDNLWMNLTDGTILCGRKFHDGSGGNNHAVEHYEATRYPLAVKLGTVAPDAVIDVYSYDEDDMVLDSNLEAHLAHFGISIAIMEKSDKSMIELEIDLNNKAGEWAALQESGCQLKPLFGPGFTGLQNLGNSCYLNSVMQTVFTVDDFVNKYYFGADQIFNNSAGDVSTDLNVQLAKLAHGLLSGIYSKPPTDENNDANSSQPGIRLSMFKRLIGKGHPEFSTKKQQDAPEFFVHLINLLERSDRQGVNPADCFKFNEESRTQCVNSGKVKYETTPQYVLRLSVPLDKATNAEAVAQYEAKKCEALSQHIKWDPSHIVRPIIPLSCCLEEYAAPMQFTGFLCPLTDQRGEAVKTNRLASFPDYLFIQVLKYTYDEAWQIKKLDISLDVPDVLDLTSYRGKGIQPGEDLMPDEQKMAEPPVDREALETLTGFGLSRNLAVRALYANNGNIELATEWAFNHAADQGVNDPFLIASIANGSTDAEMPSEDSITSIECMGFTRDQAILALKNTGGNAERAIDWIFSHQEELDTLQVAATGIDRCVDNSRNKVRDGIGRYKLHAFISHMGTSTHVGHYVCHILRDGRWVIFNDNKVALSEVPPKDLAYMYLYKRVAE